MKGHMGKDTGEAHDGFLVSCWERGYCGDVDAGNQAQAEIAVFAGAV